MKNIFTKSIITKISLGLAIGLLFGFIWFGQAPPVVHLSFQTKADMYLFQAQDGQGAALMGESTAGDQEVRTFWYSTTSTAVDDGVNILKPTAITHPAPGRWIRVDRAQLQSDWTQATTTALDYIKNKPASTKRQETYSGTTNASGLYTVAYGVAYSVTPNVQFNLGTGANNKETILLTASSTTGFTAYVQLRADVLGLLPSYSNVSGRNVDVLVTEK